jgi:hypothetical protein
MSFPTDASFPPLIREMQTGNADGVHHVPEVGEAELSKVISYSCCILLAQD